MDPIKKNDGKMEKGKKQGSFKEALDWIFTHPIRFLAYLAVYVVVGLGVVIGYQWAVYFIKEYAPKIFIVALAAMMATLPMAQAMAGGVSSQTTDTNVYAAVFISSSMNAPMTVATNDSSFAPIVSYSVAATTNGPVPNLQGLSLGSRASSYVDFSTLSNSLYSTYGVTLIGQNQASQTMFSNFGKLMYSSFGKNGSPVSSLPNISFDQNTGSVTVNNAGSSNSVPAYTVVCVRGDNLGSGVNWTPICTNTVPAGYTVHITDDNASSSSGFYQLMVQQNSVPNITMRIAGKAVPGMAADVGCMVAVIVIVIGTLIIIYLYHLCKKLLPPLPQQGTNNNSYFIMPSFDLAPSMG